MKQTNIHGASDASDAVASSGMILPTMAHRFRVKFKNDLFTLNYDDLLTMQVNNCKMNFKEKTINMDFRNPVIPVGFIKMLDVLATNTTSFKVELLNSSHTNVTTIMHFNGVKCVSHHFDLDYSIGNEATHKFVFKYDWFIELDPNEKINNETNNNDQ